MSKPDDFVEPPEPTAEEEAAYIESRQPNWREEEFYRKLRTPPTAPPSTLLFVLLCIVLLWFLVGGIFVLWMKLHYGLH